MSKSGMQRTRIDTSAAPAAIGPYSQAIRAGDLVFTSGQIPLDTTGAVVAGDFTTQAAQVMRNLGAVLDAAGTSFAHVVKVTCFLADMSDFSAFNQVYGEFVSEPFPARACIQAARLPKDVKIEVEAVALVPAIE